MLKVGIITLSASDNCGSLLQTYALQQVIEERYECEVDIINFKSQQSEQVYALFPNNFYLHPKKTLFTLMNFKSIKKQKKDYQDFRNNYLNLTEKVFGTIESLNSLEGYYDILITGSDQVWNINMTDYSDAFFIPWDNKANKIAYAASLGSIKSIEDQRIEKYKKMIDNFSSISIREETGKKIIEVLTDKRINVTADPTLLLSTEKWDKLAGKRKIKEPYIFYYSWSYPDEEMNRLVERFALEKSIQVIVINSSRWYKYRPEKFKFKLHDESGPIAFLNLMKYAEYVFVQSFHGIIFANLLKKRFFYLNEKESNQVDFRIKGIISLFHEEEQIVHTLDGISSAMQSDLKYSSVEYKQLIKKSFEFLDQSFLKE